MIFTRSATEGINLVAYAWGLDNLGPGDVVVVTELEHHSNFVPWQYVAKRTGAEFRAIPFDDNGELVLESLDEIAAAGNVKVVANNLVSNSLGTINPSERLGVWAHEQGAIMVVDAAQAAPHRTVDVQALGADFVAISSHKMCGPTGVGALWGKRELLEQMAPFNLGGEMIRSVKLDKTTWNELPYKFEAGTPAIAEAVGFGAAVDYLTEVGLEAIEAHEHELLTYALEKLGEIEGVDVLRPAAGAPRRDRLVQRRGDPPARRRAGARLGGDRDPRRPPLHAAADDAARGCGHVARELLPLLRSRGGRPPRRRGRAREEGAGMSEFDQLYREVILDHYKNPRGHGVMEDADADAEGMNPLCGDEVTIYVRFAEDSDTIDEVKFSGRGCAISQAATSMLTEMVQGKKASDVAVLDKDELLDEIGIPLTPIRLKCAMLGLTTLKVALHKAKGTPLPQGLAGYDELELT